MVVASVLLSLAIFEFTRILVERECMMQVDGGDRLGATVCAAVGECVGREPSPAVHCLYSEIDLVEVFVGRYCFLAFGQ